MFVLERTGIVAGKDLGGGVDIRTGELSGDDATLTDESIFEDTGAGDSDKSSFRSIVFIKSSTGAIGLLESYRTWER